MPAPVNTLKHRLAKGDVLHGIWLGLADAYAAEIAASADFDWLLIDGEHAPNDIRSLSAQLAVIEGKGPVPILRLPDDDPAKIKQALDIGAQTLLVPMVETGAQAEAILRATRYAPEGIRGVGSALARASRFAAIPDYLTSANAQICLLLQVESRAGLAALDDILAVPGVDGVFIGPSDLAADLRHLGNPGHPEVKAAVLDALRRIRAAGRSAGVLSTDAGFIADCTAAGANFVGVGIDVTLFATALRQLARQYRG
ncbi:HpcH/HpaI aldolase/citrate lyase family protein (plasmid) [Gemmobacter fulvus]|uniref:Hydroxypyruvate/pyruvate aldolase n=1 Tax=Gemmobacter fulvus TaxID=2840474 RepID=A0A975P9Y0_9RHOB|nr:HpcH/HpaI aldolase/citrate lyase family protein [Gemmobacter fulvus]MBT9246276.1 HpcH/HpaI aldolase/citrate lyase family protein [Gemmobacter fulvus]QWK92369.1 HpcH/HpaI aldolase/citrate lyase family protein [Gemmobacter fulvus]